MIIFYANKIKYNNIVFYGFSTLLDDVDDSILISLGFIDCWLARTIGWWRQIFSTIFSSYYERGYENNK